MRSLTAVCQTGASSMPPISQTSGRVSRHPPHRADGENAEMKMYLSKLKDLVPFMPKNRKLSKLEIIQHVIDYICDLQTELETHPEINNFDAASALNAVVATQQQHQQQEYDNEVAERLAVDQHQQQQQQQQLQQQQQQHSSPATQHQHQQRQPLVDRQAPNTILPTVAVSTAATAAQLYQQQQQQQPQLSLATVEPSSQTQTTEKDSSSSRQSC